MIKRNRNIFHSLIYSTVGPGTFANHEQETPFWYIPDGWQGFQHLDCLPRYIHKKLDPRPSGWDLKQNSELECCWNKLKLNSAQWSQPVVSAVQIAFWSRSRSRRSFKLPVRPLNVVHSECISQKPSAKEKDSWFYQWDQGPGKRRRARSGIILSVVRLDQGVVQWSSPLEMPGLAIFKQCVLEALRSECLTASRESCQAKPLQLSQSGIEKSYRFWLGHDLLQRFLACLSPLRFFIDFKVLSCLLL